MQEDEDVELNEDHNLLGGESYDLQSESQSQMSAEVNGELRALRAFKILIAKKTLP